MPPSNGKPSWKNPHEKKTTQIENFKSQSNKNFISEILFWNDQTILIKLI